MRTIVLISRITRIALLGLAMTVGASTARAATIVVDGAVCTLGEAITAANANTPFGGCRAGNDSNAGGDLIDLRVDVLLTWWDNLDADGCPNGLPPVSSRILINGNDHTISRDVVNGAPSFRLFDSSGGQLILSHVTVKNGQGEFCDGGGIKGNAVTLLDSTVSANTVYLANGGGIAAQFLVMKRTTLSDNLGGGAFVNGQAILDNSIVTRNSGFSDYSGGGLDVRGSLVLDHTTVSDNRGGGAWAIGGGIYVDGTAKITSSTISGNLASGDIGVGGGLFLFSGNVTFVNSTISGNLAQGGSAGVNYSGSGGGVFSTGIDPAHTGPGGTVTLIHSTVSNNSAFGPYAPPSYVGGTGGGILSDALKMTNTIVAGNVATNSAAGDCSAASVQYLGLNFIGDGSCDATSSGQLTGDALLMPLGHYGGATMTQPPRAGSPVIDRIGLTPAGRCAAAKTVRIDQRDSARPYGAGGGCDIGSVEYTGPTITTTSEDTSVKIHQGRSGEQR